MSNKHVETASKHSDLNQKRKDWRSRGGIESISVWWGEVYRCKARTVPTYTAYATLLQSVFLFSQGPLDAAWLGNSSKNAKQCKAMPSSFLVRRSTGAYWLTFWRHFSAPWMSRFFSSLKNARLCRNLWQAQRFCFAVPFTTHKEPKTFNVMQVLTLIE